MSDPLVTSDDLALALNDPTINEDRADFWIGQAQTLCESIVTPLPATASVVVCRVAARAYKDSTGAVRGQQVQQSGSPLNGLGGGVWLSRSDKSDLRRLGGSGDGFSIDLLPANYVLNVPIWDQGSDVNPQIQTS